MKLCFSPFSPSSSQPACTASLPPPLFSAATTMERPGGHLLLDVPLPRGAAKLSTALCLRAGAFPALPRAQIEPPAATSPPPWPLQRSTPDPYLARAPALKVPQQTVPLVLLPFPHSQTSERRRRPNRTTASRAHRGAHSSSLPPLNPTPPIAPPHLSASSQPLLVAQSPPEHPRRRAPPPPRPCSPWTAHLRPSLREPRVPRASPRSPLSPPPPIPHRR